MVNREGYGPKNALSYIVSSISAINLVAIVQGHVFNNLGNSLTGYLAPKPAEAKANAKNNLFFWPFRSARRRGAQTLHYQIDNFDFPNAVQIQTPKVEPKSPPQPKRLQAANYTYSPPALVHLTSQPINPLTSAASPPATPTSTTSSSNPASAIPSTRCCSTPSCTRSRASSRARCLTKARAG